MKPTFMLQLEQALLAHILKIATKAGLSEHFLRFAIVGSIGFCWDTATVYCLRSLVNLYIAGTAGFIVAASANWGLNRVWTFRHTALEAAFCQWLKFLAANFVGFTINRGIFFTLISINYTCRSNPILPIIAGSISALAINYFLSKRFVFR
jgi:putative flippase GtrA